MPPKQSTNAVSSLSDKKLSARGEVARAKLQAGSNDGDGANRLSRHENSRCDD